MSSNSGSTSVTKFNPSHPKVFDYNDKEGIENYINQLVENDLEKSFPGAIKANYSLNPNTGYSQLKNSVNVNDSITLKLLPINQNQNQNQNQLNPNVILRLHKIKDLTEDFDPDLWKYFYQINDPFFNYDYGENLSDTKLEGRNEEDPNIIETYEGQVNEKGEKHGFGKLYSGNKILAGNWREGQFTGWGREVDENGGIYEGKFINGKLYGKGIYFNGKEYYLGEFRNKKMLGFGEIFSDEYHYYGQLWDKIPNGKGKKCTYKEGSYEGDFENGEISGNGVYKWNNGNYYVGEMRNGKMNGYGKLVHRNGKIDKGYFRNGYFVRYIED